MAHRENIQIKRTNRPVQNPHNYDLAGIYPAGRGRSCQSGPKQWANCQTIWRRNTSHINLCLGSQGKWPLYLTQTWKTCATKSFRAHFKQYSKCPNSRKKLVCARHMDITLREHIPLSNNPYFIYVIISLEALFKSSATRYTLIWSSTNEKSLTCVGHHTHECNFALFMSQNFFFPVSFPPADMFIPQRGIRVWED